VNLVGGTDLGRSRGRWMSAAIMGGVSPGAS
jgi:hypothetical protein